MNTRCFLLLIFTLLTTVCAIAQENALLHGKVLTRNGVPIDGVVIANSANNEIAITNKKGEYQLQLPPKKEVMVSFKHLSFIDTLLTLTLEKEDKKELDIVMKFSENKLDGVKVASRYEDGYLRVDPKLSFSMPTPLGGAESLIKMMPGVSSVNELSSQYNVRGGNYDENLVFVNDIQIYRPFLVRNGMQEGLSFVNMDLTENVIFSAGGFPACYGDKMSSVMDVQYKTPKKLGGSFSIGLLGATAHVEGVVKDKEKKRDVFTYLLGVRYKNNKYMLSFMDTQGDYKPQFFDTQMLLGWNVNDKFDISFLGNISINKFQLIPQDRETYLGSLTQLQKFTVFFDGNEVDNYKNYLGALTFNYKWNPRNSIKWIVSSYYAKESETYDIQSQYFLSDVEVDFDGESDDIFDQTSTRGYGTYLEHARNHITAWVSAAEVRGSHTIKNNKLQYGVKFQNERIEDKIYEWQMFDSSSYALPHIPTVPNDSIGVDFDDPSRVLDIGDHFLQSTNDINTLRITGFIDDTWRIARDSVTQLILNGGLRFHYWSFNNEFNMSPRLSLLYKPKWQSDWMFMFKTGVYYQTPFYRELRNKEGELNKDIKSQFSYQVLLSADYNFKIKKLPFKLTSEVYYKYLDNLISYTVDNLRITYSGMNDSKGYAVGLDVKISGELIEGLESWLTLSVMKTAEKLDGTDEFIRRPTDQRFMANLFFQDHIPGYKKIRVHLNFVYSTGLPHWNPDVEKTPENTYTMRNYFRADIGFSYMFLEQSRDRYQNRSKFLRSVKNMGLHLEVFNVLGINNVSSYTWIPDLNNQQWAIPNYLTPRLINLKFSVEF